jgi:hypothetical protein
LTIILLGFISASSKDPQVMTFKHRDITLKEVVITVAAAVAVVVVVVVVILVMLVKVKLFLCLIS